LKTLAPCGSHGIFYSDVRATIAMLWRHGCVSIYWFRFL